MRNLPAAGNSDRLTPITSESRAPDDSTGREYCCERGDRRNCQSPAFVSLWLADLLGAVFKVEEQEIPARSPFLLLGRQAHSLSSADLSESVDARLSRWRSRSPWRAT